MDVASLIALAEAGATVFQKVQAARAALSEPTRRNSTPG